MISKRTASQKAQRPFLGVLPKPRDLAIAEVLPNGPADRAGLRKGDVIASINGNPVETVRDITAALRSTNEVTVKRTSHTRDITVGSVNLADEKAVAALLIGKGDKVPGTSSIKLFQRCSAQCDCVDGGMACERWYTFEGHGDHGGTLMTIHCKTTSYSSTEGKTVQSEKTRGPLEYF